MPDRPALPGRFYETVAILAEGDGFAVRLDGKPVRTPAKRPLVLPSATLADAVADEWRKQGRTIDPSTMPLARLANSALDGVADRTGEVVADVARYAGSDLVAYRAGEPERLVAAQSEAWDPVVAFARTNLGARITLSEGVTFVPQPDEALRRIRDAVERVPAPFGLAALHVMTTLTGSVLIPLRLIARETDIGEAWRAAHVDEFHQESVWGQDGEAASRRAAREVEFAAAWRLFSLSV